MRLWVEREQVGKGDSHQSPHVFVSTLHNVDLNSFHLNLLPYFLSLHIITLDLYLTFWHDALSITTKLMSFCYLTQSTTAELFKTCFYSGLRLYRFWTLGIDPTIAKMFIKNILFTDFAIKTNTVRSIYLTFKKKSQIIIILTIYYNIYVPWFSVFSWFLCKAALEQ